GGVARIEVHFAGHHRHPERIAIIADALHHAAHVPAAARLLRDVAESERVELRDGPRTHGEDVAVDAAHTRCRTLVRLNGAGVVVAFDLEGAAPALTDVDEPGVLLPGLH